MRKGACNSVYGEIQTWLSILFLVIPYTVMHTERMRSQLRQRYTVDSGTGRVDLRDSGRVDLRLLRC